VLSGMFVNVQFQSKVQDEVSERVFISENALVKQGQLTGIYVATDDKIAILRWLRTGRISDGKIEVTSGLRSGENYIVSSEGKLYNGAKITF